MPGSRRPVVIDADLQALARTLDPLTPFTEAERERVKRMAEGLEAIASDGERAGSRVPVMALSLALAHASETRALINGQQAHAAVDLIFDGAHSVARMTGTLIDQRRALPSFERRRMKPARVRLLRPAPARGRWLLRVAMAGIAPQRPRGSTAFECNAAGWTELGDSTLGPEMAVYEIVLGFAEQARRQRQSGVSA
jgi:hypothetical protein